MTTEEMMPAEAPVEATDTLTDTSAGPPAFTPSDGIKLSICMIVKNEEANLKRCLDSFLPIIHEPWCELVIVDTGSTDRTLETARMYTEHVYEQTFVPWNFSDARNYGVARATGRRIMIVDADEELDQKSLYILEDALLNPRYAGIKTLFVKLRNYYAMGTNEFAEVIQARIFENTGGPLYEFAIHNKPRVDAPYMFLDHVIFNHYGYLFQKADLYIEKKERSLPMLEAEYEKNPDDLHILTHLIKTYYACGDHRRVTEFGERWMELMRGVDFHEGWFAYLEVFANVMGAYVQLKDGENAERVLAESLKYTDRLVSLYLLLGQYYMEAKNTARARELFEEAILVSQQEGDPYELLCSTNSAVILPEIYNLLAILEFADGNYEKAGKYLNQGIRMNENRLPLRWDVWNETLASARVVKNESRKKRVA